MVQLKSKNLFINRSNYTMSRILEFYDLIGLNVLYLHNDKTTLGGLVSASKKSFTNSNFPTVLKDNLFRVDIVVIDGKVRSYNELYRQSREITNVPIIFISNGVFTNALGDKSESIPDRLKVEFDTIYHLSKEKRFAGASSMSFTPVSLQDLEVEELKEGWKSNLKELKVQYIRDKNLSDLLGDSE